MGRRRIRKRKRVMSVRLKQSVRFRGHNTCPIISKEKKIFLKMYVMILMPRDY